MDIRSRSSKILKESDVNRAKSSSQSYRSNSDIMDNRGSPMSSKFSDAHSKRPRLSPSNEQGQPDSFPSTPSSNFESTSECSPNNSSILHRVTNKVSGLFSNVSWSEWLKGSGSATSTNDKYESFSESNSAPEASRHDNHLLNPLYPEEGIACVSSTEMASSSSHQSSTDKSDMPMKMNIPSFKDQSFISSTTTLSPYPKKRRVNEEYLCDSITPKPSTSEYRREISAPQENSINLLKKSFPEAHSETFNGSSNAFPFGRKRLREALEENKEEICSESTYQNSNKKRPLTNQMFSQETDVPLESANRKRPRFSISTYGSPLYSKQAEEEEPSFSIFYPGKIMYGGASNHQRKKNRIIPRKVCTRTPAVNPTNTDDHSDGGLSSAARRILDCIDKISTPLSASKRAFDFNHSRDYSFNASPYVADFHKHRPSLKTGLNGQSPPVTKLLTPAKVKITKNFSSLFEVKTSNISTEPKETSVASSQASVSDNLNKASLLKTFASPSIVNSTRKDIPTPSENQSNNIKSFFAEKIAPIVEHNKKTVHETTTSNLFTSGLKFPSVERVSKSEEKRTVNGNIKKDNTAKRSDSDNTIQYSFSKPDIVSGIMGKETIPICTAEFKFSHPIDEVETQSEKEVQSLGFSFKKDSSSWDCDTCLLRNKGEDEKCVACTAAKPMKVPSQTTHATIVDPFKKIAGSWDCETCLLRNKSEDDKCVACMATRCNKPAAPTPKPAITGFIESWGDSFKAATGTWDCEMCMLQNKSHVTKCAACETPKPTSNQKKPVNNTFGTTTAINNWDEPFKPIEESWTCDTCKMQNTSKSFTCTGCKTPKSNLSKNENDNKTKSSNFSFGIQAKDNSSKEKDKLNQDVDNWLCPKCITTNKITDLKCLNCSTTKPELVVNSSFKNSQTTSFDGFGSKFLKSKDEWECDTCLVRNKSSAQKCLSCATSKTGTTSASISEAFKGNFKFGVNTSQTKSASNNFGFGSNSKSLDVNNANTFQLKSNTEPSKEENTISFKFGADSKPSEKKTPVNPISSNLTSFSEKKDSLLPEKANNINTTPLASSNFIFGNPTSSTTSSSTSATSSTTVTPFSKPLLVNTENKTQEKTALPSVETKSTPMFQFGASLTDTPKTESKLEFPKMNSNSPTQPELPKVNPSTFSFFGNTAAPAASSTFGTPEVKAPFNSESNTSNPLLTFGSKEVKSSNNGFNFGGTDTNKPSVGAFTFGNVETKPNSSFNFGNAEPSKPSTTGVFNFGNVDNNKPSTGGFNFGSGPASASLFKFGQPSTNAFSAPAMKPTEVAPLALNIETPNPFNVLASSSGEQPQKRVFKKGIRRFHK